MYVAIRASFLVDLQDNTVVNISRYFAVYEGEKRVMVRTILCHQY